MEKIWNDIVTCIALLPMLLKISIIALLAILMLLSIRSFVKDVANKNNKVRIRFTLVLFMIILAALIILFSLYSF